MARDCATSRNRHGNAETAQPRGCVASQSEQWVTPMPQPSEQSAGPATEIQDLKREIRHLRSAIQLLDDRLRQKEQTILNLEMRLSNLAGSEIPWGMRRRIE